MMSKLSKQQIILLSVMVLVVLYGAIELLGPRRKALKTENAADLSAVIAGMKGSLDKEMLTVADKYAISQAESEWKRDPFPVSLVPKVVHKKTAADAKIRAEELKASSMAYTGFFDIGKKRMAIINGNEYKIGENLDSQGHFLENIGPNSVTIENRISKARFEVKLKE